MKFSNLRTVTAALMIGLSSLCYASDTALRVGASPGPFADFLKEAAKKANGEGFKVEVTEFTEPTQINEATQAGDIDVSNFQHVPYMQRQNESRGYKISAIKPAYVAPGGIYSAKYKSLAEIPNGAKIGIPNDPANESRALALLQKAGLIKLKDPASISASVRDVAENPKNLDIILLDEIMLPRSLSDLGAAFVTLNKGVLAGLDPKNAIMLEDKTSPWAIVWSARNDKVDDPQIKRFIAVFESEPIKNYIVQRFNGTVIPAW
ncbi:MetQ/NlpA family ABC transporter substrate-binding protein [Microvirga yunnanensis]|uniref:MetQ/NlpA family ABC transporter substrate-binding protein n=1 Tax=Microvirga yunnanensis TaxID=2953740 RepID=UPI0021C5A456|nr:MetQ/NlpA family ABC transporter substrate-binding protein [Microvirga sp. HBU65207]